MTQTSKTWAPKALLTTSPNPHKSRDYVISILQQVSLNGYGFLFGLRYVPDKLLLDHDGLALYLEEILTRNPDRTENFSPEKRTHHILEDIMDEVVPRWIEIQLHHEENRFGQTILVAVEDRQPHWDNAALLHRLPALF